MKWNRICSESHFSWHQLVWKRLIWTACCYQSYQSSGAPIPEITCQTMSSAKLLKNLAGFCPPPPLKTWTLLAANGFRVFVLQHIIRGNRPIKAEMAHQLYVLQVLTFNLLEERMMTKMDPNDQVKTHRTINALAVSSSRVEVLNNSF